MITIELSGGVIQRVYSRDRSDKDVEIAVLDWDNVPEGDTDPNFDLILVEHDPKGLYPLD